jgi:hypothetical protein
MHTVHPIVVGDSVYVHGSLKGRAKWFNSPILLACREVLADVPSYLRHPERACPATTWYATASIRGELIEVTDPLEKGRVLQRMMELWQPEGGHRPVSGADPTYTGPLRGVRVVRVEGTHRRVGAPVNSVT